MLERTRWHQCSATCWNDCAGTNGSDDVLGATWAATSSIIDYGPSPHPLYSPISLYPASLYTVINAHTLYTPIPFIPFVPFVLFMPFYPLCPLRSGYPLCLV